MEISSLSPLRSVGRAIRRLNEKIDIHPLNMPVTATTASFGWVAKYTPHPAAEVQYFSNGSFRRGMLERLLHKKPNYMA